MGQMLLETERAKPPGDNQHKKQDRSQRITEAPILSELGLTNRESAEAQLLADLSDEDFEKIKAGKKTFGSPTVEQKWNREQFRVGSLSLKNVIQ